MVSVGGTVSIVKVTDAVSDELPSLSLTAAVTVCEPSAIADSGV